MNIVQVHPTSLAEWQKQIGIGILHRSAIVSFLRSRLGCSEISIIRLITASAVSIIVGGAKSLIRFNRPIKCCSSPLSLKSFRNVGLQQKRRSAHDEVCVDGLPL